MPCWPAEPCDELLWPGWGSEAEPPLLPDGGEGKLEEDPPLLDEDGEDGEDDGEPWDDEGEPEPLLDGDELGGLGSPPLGLGWVMTLCERHPASTRALQPARTTRIGLLRIMFISRRKHGAPLRDEDPPFP